MFLLISISTSVMATLTKTGHSYLMTGSFSSETLSSISIPYILIDSNTKWDDSDLHSLGNLALITVSGKSEIL